MGRNRDTEANAHPGSLAYADIYANRDTDSNAHPNTGKHSGAGVYP